MATEILINDGGAPARILPFTAGEDLSAGDAVIINASGKAMQANTNVALFKFAVSGWALVDASSGEICSIITGRGVILNAAVDTLAQGSALMMGTSAGGGTHLAGQLELATNTAAGPMAQAIALDASTSGTLCRILTI